MSRRQCWLAALAAALVSLAGAAGAAEVRLNNLDAGTGTGLDDPTTATPVGGNPGRTRGEQARIVFQFAASLWGSVLKSRVPIVIDASFKKLACTATGGTLGSAYATNIFLVNPGTPGARPGVAYHAALASALEGADVAPGESDVNASFNGYIGTPGCAEGSHWYMGLDGNAPAGQSNFLNVVLHEMAHGLGFSGFNNVSTGQPLMGDDGKVIQDIYSIFVYDNAKRQWWYGMSDAERKSSVRNDGHLVFTGRQVKADAPIALSERDALHVAAPAQVAGNYDFNRAPIGPAAGADNFSGAVVLANSGGNAQACAALDNAADIAGHIAMIDLGGCDVMSKLRLVQAAGATGVILVAPQAAAAKLVARTGAGSEAITIPVIEIGANDGVALEANLAGLSVDIRKSRAGMDTDGNVQLYAPTTLRVGSSFAHFDVRLSPNALMEWAESADLKGHVDLDLTPSLFIDEGWRVNGGGQLLRLCDTGVPTWLPGGVIIGANIAATAKMLASTSATLGDYSAGMRAHAAKLASDKLLSAAQASSLNACLSDAELARQYESWRQGGSGDPAVVELDSGKLLPDQAGAAGSERLYLLTVPPGARTLNIRSFGGTGDVSLLVKAGNEPTASSYQYRSMHLGNNESVVAARPAPGAYFIKLVGVRDYAGVSLQASYGM